jgi:hypothetical protein
VTYEYAIVVERARKAIHVIRLTGDPRDAEDIDEIAEKAREWMLVRYGEQDADVVIVQGSTKEDLRLFGIPASKARVRAALFNAALAWSPIELR